MTVADTVGKEAEMRVDTCETVVEMKSPVLAKGSQEGGEGQRERKSFIPKRWKNANGIVRVREQQKKFSFKGEKNIEKNVMESIAYLLNNSVLEKWCCHRWASSLFIDLMIWVQMGRSIGSPGGNFNNRVWPKKRKWILPHCLDWWLELTTNSHHRLHS